MWAIFDQGGARVQQPPCGRRRIPCAKCRPFAPGASAPNLVAMVSHPRPVTRLRRPRTAHGRPGRSGAARPTVRCAVCGTEQPPAPLPPRAAREAPDLDLRPGEPLRCTMASWLQQCPHCGYAAPEIARAHPAAVEAVGAAPFRALIDDTTHPPLARRFLA